MENEIAPDLPSPEEWRGFVKEIHDRSLLHRNWLRGLGQKYEIQSPQMTAGLAYFFAVCESKSWKKTLSDPLQWDVWLFDPSPESPRDISLWTVEEKAIFLGNVMVFTKAYTDKIKRVVSDAMKTIKTLEG